MCSQVCIDEWWLNGFVGRLVSIPSYAFYLQEKAMHKEHHTFTQDLNRDPELIAEIAGCTYAGGASGLPEGVDLAAVAAAGRNGFKKVPMDRAQYIERFTNLYGYLEGKLKKFYCARQPSANLSIPSVALIASSRALAYSSRGGCPIAAALRRLRQGHPSGLFVGRMAADALPSGREAHQGSAEGPA